MEPTSGLVILILFLFFVFGLIYLLARIGNKKVGDWQPKRDKRSTYERYLANPVTPCPPRLPRPRVDWTREKLRREAKFDQRVRHVESRKHVHTEGQAFDHYAMPHIVSRSDDLSPAPTRSVYVSGGGGDFAGGGASASWDSGSSSSSDSSSYGGTD